MTTLPAVGARLERGDRCVYNPEVQSLKTIIEDVNRTLRGWFEYFKHSHRYTFSALDGWIRMRRRSILHKRLGLKGRGRGQDHQRWPNAFFARWVVFSGRSPSCCLSILEEVKPFSGEPCAGDPHARFGGRGD